MFNPFKYRNNSASLDTSPPDTRGPNRGCPTPIVPLTTNESTVQTNIAAMRHWSGGGTNQAEGLAWGWRVLSPTAPFTEGVALYGARQRAQSHRADVGRREHQCRHRSGDGRATIPPTTISGLWRDFADGGLLGQLIGGILRGILPPQYRRNITSSTSYVTYVNSRAAAALQQHQERRHRDLHGHLP